MTMQEFVMDEEERRWESEIESVQVWWRTEHQQTVTRPYSAAEVVSLRGDLPVEYPASVQALKLRRLLRQHHDSGTSEMTFGMIDPILASQMEGQGTIYVSGALCAFAASECMGQDTSDYPWDTVPKAADRIFKSQMYHDRRQRHDRMRRSPAERAALGRPRDYLLPIVADADMGFGTATATMKLVKRLVESGVAMFHLDDLALDGKRHSGPAAGHTIVSTDEYLRRLTAARLQLDIMGSDTMIMCRCDADGAEYISTDQDPRDHGYILGASVPTESLASAMKNGMSVQDWKTVACAVTFDEAVRRCATSSQLAQYFELVAGTACSLAERRLAAKKALDGHDLFFDWGCARMPDGRYLYHSTLAAVVDRSLAAAPLGEVTWARLGMSWSKLSGFHEAVRKVYPDRLFAAGYGGTYDFRAGGYSDQDVRDFHRRLAGLGVVWQVQPAFAMQGLNHVTRGFSRLWAQEGIGGYVREIQTSAVEADTDGYENLSWSGAYLADAYTDILRQ